MTKVRRIDFYPDDFMVGIIGMPPEEIGAYWVVCCLIYSQGGPIDDDPKWLATATNCHQRTWKALRSALIRRGKLREVGGKLTQTRAEKELNRARTRTEKARNNGRTGGRPPKEVSEINDLPKPDGFGEEKLSSSKQQPADNNHQAAASSQQPGPSPAGVPSPQTRPAAAPPAQLEIDRVGEAACRAAGIGTARLAVDLAIVGSWLRAGYDPDREILPAIRGVAARPSYHPPNGLKYFNRAIADFRATAAAPMPKGDARSGNGHAKRPLWDDDGPAEGTPEWWDARLALWSQHRHRPANERPWNEHWGPQPDQPKCCAPVEILTKHGLRKAA